MKRAGAGDRSAAPSGASADESGGGPSFEEALARLESLVQRLDAGDLPLEEALRAFEEGVALTRQCGARLEQAEQRIALLVREGDAPAARPFEPPEDAAG